MNLGFGPGRFVNLFFGWLLAESLWIGRSVVEVVHVLGFRGLRV